MSHNIKKYNYKILWILLVFILFRIFYFSIANGSEVLSENLKALKTAKNYAKKDNMSKQAIYEELKDEDGDQFTKSQAIYAKEHVTGDWNKNALETAESYAKKDNMSKQAIYEELKDKDGDQFTKSQAIYAKEHVT
ncbi:Ltp family lipoprotein, partial [Liquorilactobacillus nagelii]